MREKEKSLSKVSLDAVLKDFFQRKERIADLLNVILLEGNLIISADMIETMDSDSSSVMEIEEDHFVTGKRQRDKLVRIRLKDGTKISIGLEFQSTVDYDMILRIFFYTSDFLSREQKLDDAQLRLVNLVLFTGEGKWSAKTSLKELVGKVSEDRLNEVLSDFFYEVRDLKEVDTGRLKNQEVKDAIEGIQMVYAGTEELLKERREISKASLLVIVAATGRWDVYDEVMKKEGGKLIMCEAFDRLMNTIEERGIEIGKGIGHEGGIKEGIEIGRAEGLDIGRVEGRAEGRAEGERKIFINLIEIKFGKLSEGLKEQLNNCSDRAFEHLIERFYQLNDEKEIRQILLS